MAVNLLAPLGQRYRPDALPAALQTGDHLGYRLVRSDAPDERLCAWIDWEFAPSWWSSEVRDGSAWYALAPDGSIAGFAGFGSPDRSYHWLQAYRKRPDVGVFGPYGVAASHRKTGLGQVLLVAALCSLAERYRWALIPAVSGERLIASYEERAEAHVADSYDYALREARAVILASGEGSNAQAVIDDVQSGDSALDVVGVIANHEGARVRERAREAGIAQAALVWDRAAEPRAAYDARLMEAVARYEPDLVLLLGWMHLLPAAFLHRFPETINIHPAFLPFDPRADTAVMPDGSEIPAFRGARAPEATIAAGAPWGGASVHRVTQETDRGEILVRTPLQLAAGTTLAQFRERISPVEHAAVIKAIRRWCLTT
ncbi:MAG TPA: GNAT family N-acetyltransferase [Candidatus Lustribacter sp.]|nr:GNAT family N-acetyltransferase [Candidatus Lustribacter sp.]